MICEIKLKHPEPLHKKVKIYPVFLPFAGCPKRCIYCDQVVQTGTGVSSLLTHLDLFKKSLENFFLERREPIEVGFFGGTFTAIEEEIALKFVKVANHYKEKGLISRIRCSTRPDFIDESILKRLKDNGLDLVELGVQSFNSKVLKFCKRDYSKKTVLRACEIVKKTGLFLGIQLMPGLPLMTSDIWMEDINNTCKLLPEVVRIYPCLVLKKTELATLYLKKEYIPWGIKDTVKRVARGVIRLWRKGIKVIRIGLPPQKELIEKIVAGPWHPAMGNVVKSYIFGRYLKAIILVTKAKKVLKVSVPVKARADIFGYKKQNFLFLRKKGLSKENISFHNNDEILMVIER